MGVKDDYKYALTQKGAGGYQDRATKWSRKAEKKKGVLNPRTGQTGSPLSPNYDAPAWGGNTDPAFNAYNQTGGVDPMWSANRTAWKPPAQLPSGTFFSGGQPRTAPTPYDFMTDYQNQVNKRKGTALARTGENTGTTIARQPGMVSPSTFFSGGTLPAPTPTPYDFMADYNAQVAKRKANPTAYLNYIKRYPSPVNDGSRSSSSGGGGGGGWTGGGGGGWGGGGGYSSNYVPNWLLNLYSWNFKG